MTKKQVFHSNHNLLLVNTEKYPHARNVDSFRVMTKDQIITKSRYFARNVDKNKFFIVITKKGPFAQNFEIKGLRDMVKNLFFMVITKKDLLPEMLILSEL